MSVHRSVHIANSLAPSSDRRNMIYEPVRCSSGWCWGVRPPHRLDVSGRRQPGRHTSDGHPKFVWPTTGGYNHKSIWREPPKVALDRFTCSFVGGPRALISVAPCHIPDPSWWMVYSVLPVRVDKTMHDYRSLGLCFHFGPLKDHSLILAMNYTNHPP